MKDFTCDPVTARALRKIGNKDDQSKFLASQLGPNRVVRAWRDPSPTAKFPSLTGEEIINVSTDGALSFKSGVIVSLGRSVKTNKILAADLTTGACVMRIEGNGFFVQGTLGLVGTGEFDFMLEENPDPARGLAFGNSVVISGPEYIPTDSTVKLYKRRRQSPYRIRAYNHSNPHSPQLMATCVIDTIEPPLVMEDPVMAAELGDTMPYRSGQDAPFDNFVMGAHMFISRPENTEVGDVQLEELFIGFAYRGPFTTYPMNETFIKRLMSFNLPACKFHVYDEDDNELKVFEMNDTMAINDRRLNSGNTHRGGRNSLKALFPQFNCAMALVWRNTMPRKTDFAKKLYPGMLNYRHSMSKGYYSLQSVEPLITGGAGNAGANGLGHWFAMAKWPQPDKPQPINDPYLDSGLNSVYSAGSNAWAMGWGYEPGAYGGHNWYTSPGGPRSDRSVISSALAMYLTYPDGVRLQDNIPTRELIEHWNLNSFNHSNHFYQSPSLLDIPPHDELWSDKWGMDGTYYGNYYRDKAITISGDQREGTTPNAFDMDGHMYLAGWGRDPLHNYTNRGWGAMTFRSPLMVVGSMFDTMTTLMIHQLPQRDPRSNYGVRTMAWHWSHFSIAWKLGTKHPRYGFSQARVEDLFGKVLAVLYEKHTKPVYIDMEDSAYARGIRQLGLALVSKGSSFGESGGRLGLYMGHTLQVYKQTGFWHRMCGLDPRYKAALEGVVKQLDTFVLGNIVYAKGLGYMYFNDIGDGVNLDTIPANWTAWYDRLKNDPAWDEQDWVTEIEIEKGVRTVSFKSNKDVSYNQFEQWARIHRDYFPEIAHPDLEAANAEYDRYAQIVTDKVLAEPDLQKRRWIDYFYRYPGVSPFKGPAPGDLVTG